MNHYSGNAWARLELFLDSPFDADPVWSTSINNTQRNGIPVNEPTVCNGWVREMKVWLRWNPPPGSNLLNARKPPKKKHRHAMSAVRRACSSVRVVPCVAPADDNLTSVGLEPEMVRLEH